MALGEVPEGGHSCGGVEEALAYRWMPAEEIVNWGGGVEDHGFNLLEL